MPAELLDGVRRWLAESGAEPTPARVAQALREQGRVLGDAEVLGAAEQLRSELIGSGPLEPLLADPSVTDVLVPPATGCVPAWPSPSPWTRWRPRWPAPRWRMWR
ncbi:hypothetical protein ACWDAO_34090, partial [Streptomyces sp. NPDC001212]